MVVVKPGVRQDSADPVAMYLREVGRYPLLSKDDEVRLAQQIEAGRDAAEALAGGAVNSPGERRGLRRLVAEGSAAHEMFVLGNLRLVVSIARRYRVEGLALLDLIQEGNLGLIYAVEKFDWRKGFKFSTYATWWIRQAITRGVASSARTVRLPSHIEDRLTQHRRMGHELAAQYGRPPTSRELAASLALSEDQCDEMLRFASEPLSLSQSVVHDSSLELGDLVEDRGAPSPCETAMDGVLAVDITALLEVLDERERLILSLRYGLDRGEPRTLDEVGKHLHISRERVRQLEHRAMARLRHPDHVTTARELLHG
jgi:RNA polymerase sigma factor (sigma-70 family)